MAIRQRDQLPYINALSIANQRKLVSKCNVDITEAVFRQFTHLGSAGIGHHTFAFEENLVKLTSSG